MVRIGRAPGLFPDHDRLLWTSFVRLAVDVCNPVWSDGHWDYDAEGQAKALCSSLDQGGSCYFPNSGNQLP